MIKIWYTFVRIYFFKGGAVAGKVVQIVGVPFHLGHGDPFEDYITPHLLQPSVPKSLCIFSFPICFFHNHSPGFSANCKSWSSFRLATLFLGSRLDLFHYFSLSFAEKVSIFWEDKGFGEMGNRQLDMLFQTQNGNCALPQFSWL